MPYWSLDTARIATSDTAARFVWARLDLSAAA